MAELIEQTRPLTEDEPDVKPTAKPSTLSLVKDFCDYTSIHGLGRTAGAKFVFQRIIWLLLFLGGLGMTVYQLSELFNKYQSRPISTSIRIENRMNLRFPSVTICNFNPIRKSMLKTLPPADYAKLKKFLEDKPMPTASSDRAMPSDQQSNMGDSMSNMGGSSGNGSNGMINPAAKSSKATVPPGMMPDPDNSDQSMPTVQNPVAKSSKATVPPEMMPDPDNSDQSMPTLNYKRRLRREPENNGDAQSTGPPSNDMDGDGDDAMNNGDAGDDGMNNGDAVDDGDDGMNKGDDGDDDDFPEDTKDLVVSYKVEEQMAMILATLDEKKVVPLGHDFNTTVLECSYRGISCLHSAIARWKTFWHYKYGNCFVFNPGKTMKATLKANKAGPVHGLTLKLFVDQMEYIDQITKRAGFKILINQQGQMPFPYEEGISVPPGVSASIGIKKVAIIRADPFNNRSCFDTSVYNPGNLYTLKHNATYSNSACKGSCLAYNQRKHCGCMEYRFPRDLPSVPVCDILNNTVASCLRSVERLYRNNEMNCSKECPPACSEKSYKISSSVAAWPSKNYESYVISETNPDVSKKYQFRDNYLKVRIFYEELNYEVIEENLSYGIVDFVSDIGGQLGLWLGVSVLAAAEVIELLILIFFYACKRDNTEKESATSDDNIELQEKKAPIVAV